MATVLVVEDEQLLRRGLIRQADWAACGCVVAGEAKNGREGLERIEALRPDLVVTDVKMPVMDGLQMLRESKVRFGYEAIILSGYGEFDYARQALALGVADYLLKPVDLAQLEALLKKLAAKIDRQEGLSVARRAEEYVLAHLKDELTAAQIADALRLSVGHLNKLVKRDTDLTLHELITKARIDRACALLKGTSCKVYEAAEQVGYPDYKYFHTVFTKTVGVSPSEYKRRSDDQTL